MLDDEMMDDIGIWKPEYRLKLDRAWLAFETIAGHSIKTLATNIYDCGARFVFELLQNADDNTFKAATKNSALPFVIFKVYPRRIVIECNEDGFTEENLQALCAVGQSTKTEAGSGYIGNKGIGFKSVFIAASTVHIQSGPYSFQFHHKKADPGLGMVRPIWKETSEMLPSPLTRMTLTLHNDGDAAQVKCDAQLLEDQFDNLQATCLLFLQKLKRITVKFYHGDGTLQRSSQFTKREVGGYQVALETTTRRGQGEPVVKSQLYHLTRNTAVGIEPRKNQAKPKSESDKAASQSAEIVLVFPLSSNGEPLVSKRQSIFAFLPLRRSEYSFIIQSDFDTNVQREDINTTSTRNLHLRDWIAETFIQAILEFCTDKRLRYSWPAFLPSVDANHSDFWFGLNKSIATLLRKTPVLKSRFRSDLRRIRDVSILPNYAMRENGVPVLDTDEDLFLSPIYSSEACMILSDYGLQPIGLDTLVSLVECDLLQDDSMMKDDATDDEWHTVVAKFLAQALNNTACSRRIKALPLIPLRNDEWVSINSGDVYLPTTKAVRIPNQIGLKISAENAVQNPSRMALYSKLGVVEASVQLVTDRVMSNIGKHKRKLHILNWVAQLKYIYSMQTGDSPLHDGVKTLSVLVVSSCHELTRPFATDIYLPDQRGPFSPDALLKADGTAPEFSVLFALQSYVQDQPKQPPGNPLPWLTWLYRTVGFREHLRLFDKEAVDLSETSLHVLKYQPSKFLGLVEHLWMHEADSAEDNSLLSFALEDVPAQDLCGIDFPIPMNGTYLPLSSLRTRIKRFMNDPTQFPFLQLPPANNSTRTATDDELRVQWAFLNAHFGVGKDDDISFLLQALYHIQRSNPKKLNSISQVQKVYDLYEAIDAAIAIASGDERGTGKKQVQKFLSERGVLVPGDTAIWTTASECVWDAPPDMATKFSLRALYARTLGKDQLHSIERLFSKAASISNATKEDILEELNGLRESALEVKLSEAHGLYEYLWSLNCDAWDLRQTFKAAPLILARVQDQVDWYDFDDCIWSSTTIIRGKATLDNDYEDLRGFFVDVLNVKLISLELLYDELKGTTPDQDIDQVVSNIKAFADMLEMQQHLTLDCKPLRVSAIFPVSYSGDPAVLRTVDTEFAIGDRDYLTSNFRDKIALLDFELQDVRRLGPFFEWLGITDRYLSNTVEEYTSVSGESGQPIESGPRDLSSKAHCILRVAATFGSVPYQRDRLGLYEKLRSMRVIQVTNIRNCLQVKQNGQTATYEEPAGAEHISETNGLVIYVPLDRRAQDLCFSSELPRRFARWLLEGSDAGKACGRTNNEAVSILTAIFMSHLSVARAILHRQGIVTVPLEDLDAPDDSSSETDDEDGLHEQPSHGAAESQLTPPSADDSGSDTLQAEASETESVADSHSGDILEVRHVTAHSRAEANTYERPFREPLSSPHAATSRGLVQNSPARPQSRFHAQEPLTERSQYISLLSRVIAAAQSAAFPSQGAFDLSGLADALPSSLDLDDVQSFDGLDVYPTFRSASKFERDKKIGAAGELYVFELLKSLDLPGWSVGNWQSRIRTYVRDHEDYASLEPWTSPETSDLIYDDIEGEFTRLLIDCGYLAEDQWKNACPKYFIEVKSTTGPCDFHFYVSANQYRLMEEKHRSFQDDSAIYLVLRVFWLNSDRIGMRVYVNPWQLKEDGRLIFTVPSWLVTPGQGSA